MASEQKRIEAAAVTEFASHFITEEARNGLFRTWRCQQPGTGIMAFRITTLPECLIVTGDVGDLIVRRHGSQDMIPWCRGSIHSLGYFAEKVPNNITITEFDTDVLNEWAREELADRGDDLDIDSREMLEELADACEITEQEAFERMCEYVDWEFPNLRRYSVRFLWCREAIRWFVNNVKEGKVDG